VIGILIAFLSPIYPGRIDYWTELTESTEATEEEPQQQVEETGLQAAYYQQLVDEDGEPLESVEEENDTR
jgi:hypothetical protein